MGFLGGGGGGISWGDIYKENYPIFVSLPHKLVTLGVIFVFVFLLFLLFLLIRCAKFFIFKLYLCKLFSRF